MSAPPSRPRIILGVTAQESLRLMRGFPEYLVGSGWEVHVVSSAQTPVFSIPEVSHHRVAMEREPSITSDIKALASWLKVVWTVRPSVVMVGTPKAGLLGILAAWLLGVPKRVYMLRGLRLETERGSRKWVLSALEYLTSLASTNVLAVSRSLEREYLARGLTRAGKIDVLGAGSSNGVEVRPCKQKLAQSCGEGPPVVGFVGRVTPDKGISTLIDASMILTRRGIFHQLLIVGSEEPPGYLDPLISGKPIDIRRVGHVADPERYYAEMDVLCLPSLREGFPNVVLEAAANRVPTVAARVTGSMDAVLDGVTGFLFEPRDSVSLAEKLALLIQNPLTISSMGTAARRRVELEFTREAVWRRTEQYLCGRTVQSSRRFSCGVVRPPK